MPFTPFHMGAGLVAKAGLDKHMSLISFGIAQVAMDIEPGVGMLRGAAELHGWSHTLPGALVIATAVAPVSTLLVRPILGRWNKEVAHYKLSWLSVEERPRWAPCVVGAFVGTLSHIVLDGIIHADMHPLAPLSNANTLLGLVNHDAVYSGCAIAMLVGGVGWVLRKWFVRQSSPSSREVN
jgi:hypothetical protein